MSFVCERLSGRVLINTLKLGPLDYDDHITRPSRGDSRCGEHCGTKQPQLAGHVVQPLALLPHPASVLVLRGGVAPAAELSRCPATMGTASLWEEVQPWQGSGTPMSAAPGVAG